MADARVIVAEWQANAGAVAVGHTFSGDPLTKAMMRPSAHRTTCTPCTNIMLKSPNHQHAEISGVQSNFCGVKVHASAHIVHVPMSDDGVSDAITFFVYVFAYIVTSHYMSYCHRHQYLQS